MIVEKNKISIRFNDEVKGKINELVSKFPEDFKSYSQILRAGVMALYRERIKEAGTHGFNTQDNREIIQRTDK